MSALFHSYLCGRKAAEWLIDMKRLLPTSSVVTAKEKRAEIRKTIKPYLLVAPAIIAILIFVVYPIICQIVLSFTDWNLIRPKNNFIGFSNYRDLFTSSDFYEVLWNTLVYTGFVVAFTLGLALLFAFVLMQDSRINRWVQSAIFIPHITALISVSMVFMWLMDPQIGVFNYILRLFGLPGLKWLESSSTAMMSVIIVTVWKSVGYYTLVILGALKGVPKEIYEAAELDNASKAKTFFKITIPMISPTLFFLLVVITIASFNVFDIINVMTAGGPINSTNVLVYYIHTFAFTHMKIGYASAASTVLLLIVILLTLLYFKLLAKKVYYK